MTKKTKHSILIICEGESTESLFWGAIRSAILDGIYNIGDVVINIKPEPKSEEEDDDVSESNHKPARKKRQTIPVDSKLREVHAPLPLKWVLEGQQELEEGSSNEVWTVFDHDNHPARKEAFETAENKINGTKVQIAFSSISFEYYLLLHFEQINKRFNTSECRDKKNEKAAKRKKAIECGTNIHEDDCNGEKCVGGYARMKNYWTNTKDQRSTFNLIKDKLEVGFENAAWLRFDSELKEMGVEQFDRNPYVTTDSLVKRLTNEHRTWLWLPMDIDYTIDDFTIRICSSNKVFITNNNQHRTKLIQENSIQRILQTNMREVCGSRLLIEAKGKKELLFDKNNASWFILHMDNYNFMFSFNDIEKSL